MRSNIILYLVLYLILNLSMGYSQKGRKDSVANIKSEYIQKYDTLFTVRMGFSNSFNRFMIDKEDIDYTISPNESIRTTFSFLFRFVEIDIPLTPKLLAFNKDDEEYGKSKFFGLGTRFYFGKWMQSLRWSTTEGYYSNVPDTTQSNGGYTLYPNLKVFKITGSTSFIFNPNYSFRAVFKQREWQKKSAGSFVPTFNYYFTKITNDSPETDKLFGLALGPAYYYNWVIKDHFLVSAGGYAGIGYNNTAFDFDDDRENYAVSGITYATEFKLLLDYNTTRFFTGANISLNSLYPNINAGIEFKDQQLFFEVYLGYRFNAPARVVKTMDDVEDKLGL